MGKPPTVTWTDEFDTDGDGVVDSRTTGTTRFDKRGNVVESRVDADNDGDGTTDLSVVTSRQYTHRGGLASETITETGLGGSSVTKTMVHYDQQGRAIGYEQVTSPSGATRTVIAELDRRGRLVDYHEVADTDGDGLIDVTREQESTYDHRGRLIAETSRMTTGSFATVFALTTVYDGAASTTTTTTDDGADGSIESISISRSVTDARDRIIQWVSEDFDGDGSVDFTQTESNTFDKQGRLVLRVTEGDINGDGVTDWTSTFTTAFH
jgi:hypothetical protein